MSTLSQKKSRFLALLLLALSLTACDLTGPSEQAPAATPASPPMPTSTGSPSATPPSPTPTAPATHEDSDLVAQVAQARYDTVDAVAWSADGTIVAAGGPAGIRLYDAGTLEMLQHIDADGWIVPLAFGPAPLVLSPDGHMLAVAAENHTVQVWDTGTGRLLHTLEGHPKEVVSLAFSADGTVLVSSSGSRQRQIGFATDNDVRLWQAETGASLSAHKNTYPYEPFVWDVRVRGFAGADAVLATRHYWDSCGRRGGSSEVVLWRTNDLLATDGEVAPLWTDLHPCGQAHLAINSQDGRFAAAAFAAVCCAEPGLVRVWDAETGEAVSTLSYDDNMNGFEVTDLAFSPDGAVLAISASDENLMLWDFPAGPVLRRLQGQTARVDVLAYSPDGRLLAAGNELGHVQLWDATTGQYLHTFEAHEDRVTSLVFISNETILTSSKGAGTIRTWRVDADRLVAAAPPGDAPSMYAAISIAQVANAVPDFVERLPDADVILDGMPFRLSERIFKSQAAPAPHNTYPVSASLDVDLLRAQRLHLLLTAGNAYTQFDGQVIGRIVATCDGTSVTVTDLQVGRDVREWHAGDNVVSEASRVRQISWGYVPNDGELVTAHVDLLSVDLPAACRQGRLTAIDIVDTSVDTAGSLDPALNLAGVTVEYSQ